jgi:hypothetical protein
MRRIIIGAVILCGLWGLVAAGVVGAARADQSVLCIASKRLYEPRSGLIIDAQTGARMSLTGRDEYWLYEAQSPDRLRTVFWKQQDNGIYLIEPLSGNPLDGFMPPRLLVADVVHFAAFNWSPNKVDFALVAQNRSMDYSLFVMRGGELFSTPITDVPIQADILVQWSSNSKYVSLHMTSIQQSIHHVYNTEKPTTAFAIVETNNAWEWEFSPTNDSLVFLEPPMIPDNGDARLIRVDLQNGQIDTLMFPIHGLNPYMAWSPNGKYILLQLDNSERHFSVFDMEAMERLTEQVGIQYYTWARWVRGGEALLYTSLDGHTLIVRDVRTGAESPLIDSVYSQPVFHHAIGDFVVMSGIPNERITAFMVDAETLMLTPIVENARSILGISWGYANDALFVEWLDADFPDDTQRLTVWRQEQQYTVEYTRSNLLFWERMLSHLIYDVQREQRILGRVNTQTMQVSEIAVGDSTFFSPNYWFSDDGSHGFMTELFEDPQGERTSYVWLLDMENARVVAEFDYTFAQNSTPRWLPGSDRVMHMYSSPTGDLFMRIYDAQDGSLIQINNIPFEYESSFVWTRCA